jgi:hypothetical protein
MRSDDTAKARAEAIFRPVMPEEKLNPIDEYKARQTAERQKNGASAGDEVGEGS